MTFPRDSLEAETSNLPTNNLLVLFILTVLPGGYFICSLDKNEFRDDTDKLDSKGLVTPDITQRPVHLKPSTFSWAVRPDMNPGLTSSPAQTQLVIIYSFNKQLAAQNDTSIIIHNWSYQYLIFQTTITIRNVNPGRI